MQSVTPPLDAVVGSRNYCSIFHNLFYIRSSATKQMVPMFRCVSVSLCLCLSVCLQHTAIYTLEHTAMQYNVL